MKKGAVAFVDFLGQKGIWDRHDSNVVLANIKKLRDVVRQHQVLGSEYLEAQFKAGAAKINIEAIFVSDTMCIFCWYEHPDNPHNKLCALVYMVGKVVANLIREAALIDPPRSLRGCISVGEFDFSDDILIGKAVDEAATYHEAADGAFTFLTPSAQNCLEEAAKEGGMNDEELSLFIQYEVPVKVKARTAGTSYSAPSLNPLAGETKTEQEKVIDRMIQSFDVSDEDVQRKKVHTKKFLDESHTRSSK
jgi:hypothetical protein